MPPVPSAGRYIARRSRLVVGLVAVWLVMVACGGVQSQDDSAAGSPAPQPTVTVTVTETATPAATETVTAEPTQPGGEQTADGQGSDGAEGVCQQSGLAEQGFIFVTTPRPGEPVASPFTVEGCSNTFEANVQWRLVTRDGATISEGNTTATCGTGCVGDFSFEVAFPDGQSGIAFLEAFETSPQDGSEQLLNSIPLVLGQ